MIIHNVGYNHSHDADFLINRPNGYQDNLLLLIKTPAIFTVNGEDIIAPAGSFFIYKKGRPQYYRCMPNCTFSNDWIHFDFEDDEEQMLLSCGIKYEQPVKMDNPNKISFFIKSLSLEWLSDDANRSSSIKCYMQLIFNKVGEQLMTNKLPDTNDNFAKLSTIRNKIYKEPEVERTIDFASHEIRMSRSNFQMLYKKFFGVSFVQDLINSRIEHAKMLLLNTDMKITDISSMCGYHSYAHFARQFRSVTKTTPLAFREENKGNL